MARLWTLGGVTLPNPNGFNQKFKKSEVWHETINGRTTRDISSRKMVYELLYTKITQAIVAQILSLYEQRESLAFSATDGELSISETQVHVDVSDRDYNTKGSEFREDFVITLTEVS